jgi:hypothetical protein
MSRTRDLITAFSGLVVAGAHFTIVYVFAALACARGFGHVQVFGVQIVPFVGGFVTLAALLTAILLPPSVGFSSPARNGSSGFIGWLTFGCAGVAVVTIVLVALPLVFVPSCR